MEAFECLDEDRGIVYVKPDGVLSVSSAGLNRFLKYQPNRMSGMNLAELVVEADRDRTYAIIRREPEGTPL